MNTELLGRLVEVPSLPRQVRLHDKSTQRLPKLFDNQIHKQSLLPLNAQVHEQLWPHSLGSHLRRPASRLDVQLKAHGQSIISPVTAVYGEVHWRWLKHCRAKAAIAAITAHCSPAIAAHGGRGSSPSISSNACAVLGVALRRLNGRRRNADGLHRGTYHGLRAYEEPTHLQQSCSDNTSWS